MAHFEQAAVLATAWANDEGIKAMALKHSIVEVSNNTKLKRSSILRTVYMCECMPPWFVQIQVPELTCMPR